VYPLTLASIESTDGLTAPQNGRSQSRANVEGRRRAGLATRQIPERYREKLCVLSARFEEGYSDVTDVTGAFWEGEKGLTRQIDKCPTRQIGKTGPSDAHALFLSARYVKRVGDYRVRAKRRTQQVDGSAICWRDWKKLQRWSQAIFWGEGHVPLPTRC
jgi:hypothetical protein